MIIFLYAAHYFIYDILIYLNKREGMKLRSIKHYRRRIDWIDRRIMKMFMKRYRAVDSIGKLKKKEGTAIVDNKREHDILQKIEKLNAGIKIKNYISSIYRTVFSTSYIVEKEK